MSNLAQNIATRPSAPSLFRVPPTKRQVNRWCKPSRHATSCVLGTHRCARRAEELSPLEHPEIALFPYAFAARVTSVDWYAFASEEEVPDVQALLARRDPTRQIDNDPKGTRVWVGDGESAGARAVEVARQMSAYQSRVRPLVKRFVALLEEHGSQIPALALCSWLRAEAPTLLRAQEEFYIERAAIGAGGGLAPHYQEFSAHSLLGELASFAVERGVR